MSERRTRGYPGAARVLRLSEPDYSAVGLAYPKGTTCESRY